MADYTREELADFRSKIMGGSPDQALEVSPEAILRLLSMAERAVSESGPRCLAPGPFTVFNQACTLDAGHSGAHECRSSSGWTVTWSPAAARLAAKGGEGG